MGRFFEVFPHKARSIGGEAVPKRRDDYATGESKRWFKSSHSDQKETDANASVSFCASVAVEPAASLIVPNQRFGIKGKQRQNSPVGCFIAVSPPKAGRNGSKAVLCARDDSTWRWAALCSSELAYSQIMLLPSQM